MLLSVAQPAGAGLNVWTSGGPLGPDVTALAVDPSRAGVVYAATAGKGVFKSTDGGETWQTSSVGLGATYVESLAVHPTVPSTLYAVSPNRGFFTSTDSGAHWIAANDGLPSASAHRLAIGPAGLFLSANEGVFKSSEDGEPWMATGLRTDGDDPSGVYPSFHPFIDCLAFEPSTATLFACYFTWIGEAGPGWQLLRSGDDGDTWQGVDLPTTGGPVAVAVGGGGAGPVYVATYETFQVTSRVLSSTDGGETWDCVGGAMPGCKNGCRVRALAVDDAQPATLYAATDNGVYAHTRGGSGWRALDDGLDGRPVDCISVDPSDPSIVYAGTSDGVFTLQQAICGGDCDGNGAVAIDELVTIVAVAMGGQPITACAAADMANDGRMGIGDIVGAVEHALRGCAE
jgi:photosystem II stability/assembly factor-like uncharacterized protein